ncbi:hypothetical protein [Ovoidimarina sediminis]|uniref:hypothetical protein n=1 Tax=Ovoidimarina sediminis TaxID=3079856 RepID=UPI002930D498|nr:hypothetical protein [Rhodophyticola sp. MJ-SS7]
MANFARIPGAAGALAGGSHAAHSDAPIREIDETRPSVRGALRRKGFAARIEKRNCECRIIQGFGRLPLVRACANGIGEAFVGLSPAHLGTLSIGFDE